jgi:phage host-nuclease inhibitor protein Gam
MRQLEGPTTDELLADQYSKIMAEQKAADEAASAARQTEIDNLQTLLREEISTSADAASSQRSDMTTALENRIKELQAGVDTETAALRQQGLDERSAISAEQQRISDMVQANMDQTAADLAAQEERVKTAQSAAIGSLEDKQGSLIGDINTRIGELGASLNDTTAQINTELDARDAALTGAQKSAAEAVQQQIDAVKGDLVTIQGDIQTENAAQLQALRGERETLIGNIEANVETLKDNIAGLPIDDLQLQIEKLRSESENLKSTSSEERKDLFSQMEALRDGALTNDQVNTSIAQALEAGTLSPDQINTAIDALKPM